MGVPKRLTEKQIKFANLIVTEEGKKTDSECAIEAGYKPDGAYVCASRLQNPALYPLVTQYIGRLRAEKLKKYDITYEKHLAELGKIRDEARESKAWSAAGNMEIARGKAAGLYIDRKIIKTGKLEDLSEQELENKMKQILEDYAPILNAKQIDGEVISSESSSPKEEESSFDPQK